MEGLTTEDTEDTEDTEYTEDTESTESTERGIRKLRLGSSLVAYFLLDSVNSVFSVVNFIFRLSSSTPQRFGQSCFLAIG